MTPPTSTHSPRNRPRWPASAAPRSRGGSRSGRAPAPAYSSSAASPTRPGSPRAGDEFTFRFNRRTSKARGLLFYRLVTQAVRTAHVDTDALFRATGRGRRPGCDISRIQHTGFFDRLPPILPTRAVNLMVEQPDGTYKAEPRNLYAFSISFPNTRLAPTLVEMMPWNAANLQPHDGSMTRVPVQGRARRKQGH